MPLRGPGTFDGIFGPGVALADDTYIINQTFSGDRYYHDLTINNSLTIDMKNYALFVSGTLTIGDSVIIRPGVTGDGGAAAGAVGGAAGTNLITGTHGGSWYSGGAGSISNGANATVLSPSVGIHLGGGGGGGGGGGNGTPGANDGGYGARGTTDGGGGGAGNAGAGVAGSPGALLAIPEIQTNASSKNDLSANLYALLTGHVLVLGTLYPIYGGNGGGGGGGDGISEAGGGGAAGGGVVRILARKIVRSGGGIPPTIHADGGTGGAGAAPDGGGGGGAGGGVIMLGYGSIDSTITVRADGGAGGAGGGNGGAGGAGAAGRVYRFEF